MAGLKCKQKLCGFPEDKTCNRRKVLIWLFHKKLLKVIREKAKSVLNLRFGDHWFTPWIYFAKFNHLATQLFRRLKIIKFVDLVSVENSIFISRCFSCNSYYVFIHLYISATGRHNHQTRFAMNVLVILPSCNTTKFGTKAFSYSTITSWNSFQALLSECLQ